MGGLYKVREGGTAVLMYGAQNKGYYIGALTGKRGVEWGKKRGGINRGKVEGKTGVSVSE